MKESIAFLTRAADRLNRLYGMRLQTIPQPVAECTKLSNTEKALREAIRWLDAKRRRGRLPIDLHLPGRKK